MKTVFGVLAIVVIALAAYLCVLPVPVEPVSWQAPTPPGFVGAHAPNDRLADLETIPLKDEEGPEHIVLARDGKLYAAVASGAILRMAPHFLSRHGIKGSYRSRSNRYTACG